VSDVPAVQKNTAMETVYPIGWRKGRWHVVQCLEGVVGSQGETEEQALFDLKEALKLHFEPARPTRLT